MRRVIRTGTSMLLTVSALACAGSGDDTAANQDTAAPAPTVSPARAPSAVMDSARMIADSSIAVLRGAVTELRTQSLTGAAARRARAERLMTELQRIAPSDFINRLTNDQADELNDYIVSQAGDLRGDVERLNRTLFPAVDAGPLRSEAREAVVPDPASAPSANACPKCCMCAVAHRICCYGSRAGNGICLGAWACPTRHGERCRESQGCPRAC
jgi:hypothetical protein